MPLIVLGMILCISLLIYAMIKNKKEINDAGDRFAERLYLLYKKFIAELNANKSSTTFTTDEDQGEGKEEDKVLFFPDKDKNTED